MRGFGGLVTFLVKGADWRQTADIVDAVAIPRIGPSLGGVESLIEQPLVMSYYEARPEDRRRWGIHDNMIRMACGIENTEDLIADLKQALDRAKERGFWMIGAEHCPDAQPWHEPDYRGRICFVLGSEGRGLRRLTRETCDHLVYLSMSGHVNSLNVGAATSALIYEALRQRSRE